jgi:hypothetical protein
VPSPLPARQFCAAVRSSAPTDVGNQRSVGPAFGGMPSCTASADWIAALEQLLSVRMPAVALPSKSREIAFACCGNPPPPRSRDGIAYLLLGAHGTGLFRGCVASRACSGGPMHIARLQKKRPDLHSSSAATSCIIRVQQGTTYEAAAPSIHGGDQTEAQFSKTESFDLERCRSYRSNGRDNKGTRGDGVAKWSPC